MFSGWWDMAPRLAAVAPVRSFRTRRWGTRGHRSKQGSLCRSDLSGYKVPSDGASSPLTRSIPQTQTFGGLTLLVIWPSAMDNGPFIYRIDDTHDDLAIKLDET